MKFLIIAISLILASCSTSTPVQQPPEPTPSESPVVVTDSPKPLKLGKKIRLWSTYYFTPELASRATGYNLRNKSGSPVSGKLSLDDWCLIGLQGTGVVDGQVFTYQRRTSANRVPCERSFLRSASFARSTGEIKFLPDRNKYGSGNKGNALIPWRSIACDQSKYKFGQAFFIPSAKGAVLPNGEIHDGVFTCHDIGGAIKGNHIDTFLGFVDLVGKDFSKRYSIAFKMMPREFQGYIKSKASGEFDAYLVEQ